MKHEIELTNEELVLIIYTSVDHDWLTNMIVQAGEFLKWFNLNFEGESREEVDFLKSKHDIWEATVRHCKDVVDLYENKMTGNKEVILTKKWWQHERFSFFGHELEENLKDDLK